MDTLQSLRCIAFFGVFLGAYAINQLLQLRELGCFYIFGFVWFCNDL